MNKSKNQHGFAYDVSMGFRELLELRKQCVSAITFEEDRDGKMHTLRFKKPINIFKAIVKAEEYLSEYISHKDFWWLEDQCPRGNLLYSAVYLESVKINEKNEAALYCGS